MVGLSAVRRLPDDRTEQELVARGLGPVAGVDEVGRGAWAGPVTVGVATFPEGTDAPDGVCDSKLLTEERRESLFPLVGAWCSEWSVGHASPAECDRLGMTAALRLAAGRALAAMGNVPATLLLDGGFDYISAPVGGLAAFRTEVGDEPLVATPVAMPRVATPPVHTVVKGDACCVSIAAASILAKVTRDRLMRSDAPSFPAFEFERNKGYPSPVHRTALAGNGLTAIHRRSWSFVTDLAFR